MPFKLTDTAIRGAKPKEKRYKLTDGEGLYIEVAPTGGKWWRLKYRYAGKEKRHVDAAPCRASPPPLGDAGFSTYWGSLHTGAWST